MQRVSEERRAGNSGAAYREAQTLGTDDVCAMASLTPQQQYELLYSCGNEDINKMLEDYTEKTTVFSCIGFYEYIHRRTFPRTLTLGTTRDSVRDFSWKRPVRCTITAYE